MKQRLSSGLTIAGLILALISFVSASGLQAKSPDIAGLWDITLGAGQSGDIHVEFLLKDGRWEGKFKAVSGEFFPLDSIKLEGNRLSFAWTLGDGGPDAIWSYDAKVDGDIMEGACRYMTLPDQTFSAKKRKA
jgi:hypothetical protein